MVEQQRRGLQVCENNLIRRIAGDMRLERRIMKDLREEIGTEACIVGKIDESRNRQNERREITEKRLDKDRRRLQETKETTARMGGVPEETPREDKGRS